MLLYGNGSRDSIQDVFTVVKEYLLFLIDETMVQIGPDQAWLWVAVEPIHRQIPGVYISRHRNNMIVAESFLRSLIKNYGKHVVYSDG
jgi:transposase-like protein